MRAIIGRKQRIEKRLGYPVTDKQWRRLEHVCCLVGRLIEGYDLGVEEVIRILLGDCDHPQNFGKRTNELANRVDNRKARMEVARVIYRQLKYEGKSVEFNVNQPPKPSGPKDICCGYYTHNFPGIGLDFKTANLG